VSRQYRQIRPRLSLACVEAEIRAMKVFVKEKADPEHYIRRHLATHVWPGEDPARLHAALPFSDDEEEWGRAAVCHATLDHLHSKVPYWRVVRKGPEMRVYTFAYMHAREAWSTNTNADTTASK
jgi:hypothetical protein